LRLRRPDRKMDALSLLLCGVTSAVLYLAFVRLFPLTRYALRPRLYDLMKLLRRSKQGIILYALCILTMFWLYWQAWHFVQRNAQDKDASSRLLLVFIVGSALLFALILVWMYPINANDLFRYFFRGRIFSFYGGNPLVDPPKRFYTDPYLYTVGEWIDHRSPYGPVWELLAAGVSWLTRGMLIPNLLALKGISVLCYGGSICLVYDILGRTLPAHKFGGTLLFAWNPLILLEWIGNGHNDVVMLFFILLGMNLWVRKRYIWGPPFGSDWHAPLRAIWPSVAECGGDMERGHRSIWVFFANDAALDRARLGHSIRVPFLRLVARDTGGLVPLCLWRASLAGIGRPGFSLPATVQHGVA